MAKRQDEGTTGKSGFEKVVAEKTGNLSRAVETLSGFIGTVASSSYTGLKYLKDSYTNSSAYKYQIIGQNFEGKSIPGSISLPIPNYYSEPLPVDQLFQNVCYSNTNFRGACLEKIFIAENLQFLNCQFDRYTNFIGLAYHGELSDDVIRGRVTNARNPNGNTGGENIILSVQDANQRLKEEFVINGVVDQKHCGENLGFIYGLINIVTILSGKTPSKIPGTFDASTIKEVKLSYAEIQAILEFKVLANQIAQHFPEYLAGAFPENALGKVGYSDILISHGLIPPSPHPVSPSVPPSPSPVDNSSIPPSPHPVVDLSQQSSSNLVVDPSIPSLHPIDPLTVDSEETGTHVARLSRSNSAEKIPASDSKPTSDDPSSEGLASKVKAERKQHQQTTRTPNKDKSSTGVEVKK